MQHYTCSRCGGRFVTSDDLQRHELFGFEACHRRITQGGQRLKHFPIPPEPDPVDVDAEVAGLLELSRETA